LDGRLGFPLHFTSFWNEYLDCFLSVLPFPIVVSLGVALSRSDRVVEISYSLIALYEALKLCYSVSKFKLAFDQSLLGSIWDCSHFYRSLVAVLFFLAYISPVCFEVSDLLFFMMRGLRTIDLALEACFALDHNFFLNITDRVNRRLFFTKSRAYLEIMTAVQLLFQALRTSEVNWLCAFLVYFVFVIVRGMTNDIYHSVVYHEVADLTPKCIASSVVAQTMDMIFDVVVAISELFWSVVRRDI
jgi:hypothetical protein